MMVSKAPLLQPANNSLNWDVPLNSNFGVVTNALGSIVSISVTVANVVMTSTQAQAMGIAVSGSMLSNFSLFLPAGIVGTWVLTNSTTGNALSVYVDNGSGSPAGAGILPPIGVPTTIFSDGINVKFANDFTYPGTIISFAGTSAPTGYLVCNGSAILRATYAALFATIGTTWGSGNGLTTFNIPDLRGYFMRGSGTNSDGTVGTNVGAKQSDIVGPHNHTISDPTHSHPLGGNVILAAGGAGVAAGFGIGNQINVTQAASTGITINNSGTGIGTETRPKNQGVLYCIKY